MNGIYSIYFRGMAYWGISSSIAQMRAYCSATSIIKAGIAASFRCSPGGTGIPPLSAANRKTPSVGKIVGKSRLVRLQRLEV